MKEITEEMIEMQKEAYAVKACHMMGFSIEKCAGALHMEYSQVKLMYALIENNCVDFESGKF